MRTREQIVAELLKKEVITSEDASLLLQREYIDRVITYPAPYYYPYYYPYDPYRYLSTTSPIVVTNGTI